MIEGKLIKKKKQDSLKVKRRNWTENNIFGFWIVTLFSRLSSENTRAKQFESNFQSERMRITMRRMVAVFTKNLIKVSCRASVKSSSRGFPFLTRGFPV